MDLLQEQTFSSLFLVELLPFFTVFEVIVFFISLVIFV
jgi:hypothetical protein